MICNIGSVGCRHKDFEKSETRITGPKGDKWISNVETIIDKNGGKRITSGKPDKDFSEGLILLRSKCKKIIGDPVQVNKKELDRFLIHWTERIANLECGHERKLV